MKRPFLILVILMVVLAVAGGLTALLWPEEPAPTADEDTGMSRDQTEEFMRTIGYVQ